MGKAFLVCRFVCLWNLVTVKSCWVNYVCSFFARVRVLLSYKEEKTANKPRRHATTRKNHSVCTVNSIWYAVFSLFRLAFELWNGITFWDGLTETVLNLTETTILDIKLHFRRWIGIPTSNPIKYAYSEGFHFLQLQQRCTQMPEILFARGKPNKANRWLVREK